jgi:surfeit locus 1 family protein
MFPTVLFTRRWLPATLVVLAAIAVTIRLGIWQLDRLEQRRTFNARVQAQIDSPTLDLTAAASDAGLADSLPGMEYRRVTVRGAYDFAAQVALRNQARDGQWGANLLTPLRIAGSRRVILVDRGWIPAEDYQAGNWDKYAEPGEVEVRGVVRLSQERAGFGRPADPTPAPGEKRASWTFANLPAIAGQMEYPLLPVYIQQAPDPAWSGLPARSHPDIELTEGSHLGYAIQWFCFALIFAVGYPLYARRELARSQHAAPPHNTSTHFSSL